MGKNIFQVASKWMYAASGGSVLVGLYHYFKPDESKCEATPDILFQPSVKWNCNWDKREVASLIKPCKDEDDSSDQDKIKEQKDKLFPTATRHIFLIRHGQYEDWKNDDKDRKLTPLGQQQAAMVGQRLKQLNFKYTKLIHSSMTRAKETTNIVLKYLPTIPVESTDLLHEGNPIPSEPPVGIWREEYKYYEDGPRIEAAFRKHFHRASVEQKADSFDIIICHSNVIRYFICRVLQVAPEAWLRFSLHHCSITWIAISPNGHVRVFAVGASSFMPPDKLTRV